jgi:hypothetical protein
MAVSDVLTEVSIMCILLCPDLKSAAIAVVVGAATSLLRREVDEMITKRRLAASAAAAILGATVIATAAPAPADEQYWGAIAYSLLDGASGTASQQANESDARNAALLDCGDNGGSGCEIVVTVQRPKCASLVANESLFSTGVAEHPVDAKNSAVADLGEPGSEVASTCGFIAGTAPAPLESAASTPASATFTHPHSPAPPSPAAIPAAPTLR